MIPENPNALVAHMIRERVLASAGPFWTECVCEYEDERNYLSLCLARELGSRDAIVTVEFGVQDEATRHATGLLMATWRRPERQLGAVSVVTLDGGGTTLARFTERLEQGFLTLPATVEDFVDAA